ncbi:hypothetical protein EDC04DRAFT_2811450 [Pisolithus marmoratus]|nr:hypothetical protein EDC04DRAFT_2811450 [Pisolithus marmoratus]
MKTFLLPTNNTKANNSPVVDEEFTKRKACAERFGIPLVEPKQPPRRQAKKVSQTKQSGTVSGGLEKWKNRAERFGSTKVKRLMGKNSSGDGNALSISELQVVHHLRAFESPAKRPSQ